MNQNNVKTRSTYKKEAKRKNKLNPDHMKTKHKAKLQVRNKHGADFKRSNPREWAELISIAQNVIKKDKLKKSKERDMLIFSKIDLETPLRPAKQVYSLDVQSMEQLVQAMATWLSMNTSLFVKGVGIAPWEFRYYCYALTFAYLYKVGKLNGTLASNVPPLNSSFQLPYPLAKWMEYLAPFYHLGCCQTTEYNYSTDFTAYYDFIGDTDGFYDGTIFDYVGFPHTLTAVQSTIPQASPPAPNVPYDQTIFPFSQINGLTGVTLSSWMAGDGNMTAVSTALVSCRVPVVDVAWLPGIASGSKACAPDGSAYCVKAGDLLPTTVATSSVSVNGAILNIHNEFDVELSYLFNLYRPNKDTPAICSKPLALSLYDYNFSYGTNRPFPWYCQVYSTFVFMCSNTKGKFKRGHAKDVLNVGGARIRSLFPNPRNINSAPFSALIVQAYQQIQTMQAEAGGKMVNQATGTNPPQNSQQGGNAQEYKNAQNLWLMITCAFSALQRRFNEQCVVYVNSPMFSNNAPTLMPQCFYVDSTALDVVLPPLVSESIDAIGVVVDNKGILQIPVAVYGNNTATTLAYPLTNLTDVGPVALSAYGFQPLTLNTYPNANITTVAIAPTPNTMLVPVNVIMDNLTISATVAGVYQGFDGSANTYGTLYPFYLNGQWLQKMHKMFQTWVQSANFVNTVYKTFIKPRNPPMGKAYVMLTEVVINWSASNMEPVVPNNLNVVMNTSSGPNQVSTLSVYKLPVVSMSTSIYLQKSRAFLAMIYAWVQTFDQQVSQGSTTNSSQLLVTNLTLLNAFTGLAPPATVNSTPAGLLSVTTNAASSVATAVQDLTQTLQSPDSEFYHEKVKIDHAKTSVKSLVPRDMKTKIQNLNFTRAIESAASIVAHNLFGHTHMRPGVTPQTLGRVGKGVNEDAANVLAVTESTAGVSSDENVAVQDKYTPKIMEMKCDGHRIKKVGKALESATKSVASGLNSAVKIAGDATSIASSASAILGGI